MIDPFNKILNVYQLYSQNIINCNYYDKDYNIIKKFYSI